MDVSRNIDLEWQVSEEAGTINAPMGKLPNFVADHMSPGATPVDPEVLLLAAIASSYGITLANMLDAAALPRSRISINAAGAIASDHGDARFTRVLITPTIRGADAPRRREYKRIATTARDDCMIGRSIRGNVALVVGEISFSASAE